MVHILNLINKSLKQYDYTKDEVQALFSNPQANRDKIIGYATRIGLIWLRKKEIAWSKNLDEMCEDAILYFCEYADKYVKRKLYTHYPRVKGRNKGADSYCCYQCYCQNLQLRIGQIFHKYCQSNPSSKLCSSRKEIMKSELTSAEFERANQLEDILINKNGIIEADLAVDTWEFL